MKIKQLLTVVIILVIASSCSNDSLEDITPPVVPVDPSVAEIWDGPNLTFSKADGADPTLEANQDRITDDVWITRDNDGGPIFNIAVESTNNNFGPTGTEWAVGTVDELESLQFAPLRGALGGQRMSFQETVGTDMVLHLIEADVFISIRFTSWSQNKQGGFAYERSTQP